MGASSPCWELVYPVLRLDWDKLLAEEHPWACDIRPIPSTFRSWKRYLESFFLPTLENFRASLARKLTEFEEFEIVFGSFTVQGRSDDTLFVTDETNFLKPGDVCLISSSNPSSRELGENSKIWDGCGWMLVRRREKDDSCIMHCEIFSFQSGESPIVYAARIDSATTTHRILKSLELHKSCELFAEENINAQLKQLILTWTGKTTCVVALLLALLLESRRIIQVAPTNIAVLDVAKKLIAQKPAYIEPEKILVIVNESWSNIKSLITDEIDQYVLSSRINRLLTLAKTVADRLVSLIKEFQDLLDLHPSWDEFLLQKNCLSSVLRAVEPWDLGSSIPFGVKVSALVHKICHAAANGNFRVTAAQIFELQNLSIKHLGQDSHGQFSPKLVSELEIHFLRSASIVLCTLSGSKSPKLLSYPFEIAVVDECAQAIEAEIIGLIKSSVRSLILVGDPRQLHGTVFSQSALEAAYQRSLFERLSEVRPVHLLSVQYRMHPSISAFPNVTFYNGKITDSDSVVAYNASWYSERFPPMQFLTHNMTSCACDRTGSWFNEEESVLIILYLGAFLHLTASTRLSIGIICPYSAQKRILQQRVEELKLHIELAAEIKVSTVDGFQGQECDVVIFSLTRTGTSTNFLDQWNRMNVAITRAKYGLWVFGDARLFLSNDRSQIWCLFALHCKSTGAISAVNSAADYADPKIRAFAQRIVLNIKKQQLLHAKRSAAKQSGRVIIGSRDHHIWRVVASEAVIRALQQCSDSTSRAYSLLFSKLLMGDFSETRRPYHKSCRLLGNLFLVNRVEPGLVLLWTIEVFRDTQAISVIRRLSKSQLLSAWNAFKTQRVNHSPDYLSACVVQCDANAFPQTGLSDIPKHFWRGAGADDAVSGSIKLFDLSDGPLIEMFASLEQAQRGVVLLPYMLDEVQNQAVQYISGSVVLVGRGGCGKTSVLAQRLLIAYKTALMQDLDVPQQLFVSLSPMLVKNVKDEFERLVDTFHTAYCEQVERPQHSGCRFLSLLDLLLQLDSQIEPSQRLFHDRGSHRRLIREDDEDDLDLKTPSRQLYTVDDIVGFDRFRRIYYPHLSDSVRRLFAPEFIFTEIMFVIKGGSRTDGVQSLSIKQYCQLAESPSGGAVIPETQRKLIYDGYKCYERIRLDRHHIDYPEIVADIITRRKENVAPIDLIYLDEVQDLMPCHWRLLDLFRYSKTQLICSGDQAQCITAGNRFRFSKLKAFLFDSCEIKAQKPLQIDLMINYRTIQEVLALANRILEVVQYFFPDEIDRVEGERSARPPPELWSGVPRLFQEDPFNALKFLFVDGKELAAEQIIIVRDLPQKTELIAVLAANDWQATVLTILEVKGLEFEDVVLYNIFSSSDISSQRLRVLNYASDTVVQEFDFRKHYELCHYLKELYVAVTRCKHRLLFIDGEKDKAEIYMEIFAGSIVWTSAKNEISFSRSSTVEEWACKAFQYESSGLLREARNAFLKAEHHTDVKRLEAKILVKEFEKSRDPDHINKAVQLLIEINQVELAATHLYDAKQFSTAADLYMKLPAREQEVIECYMLAGSFDKSCQALERFRDSLNPDIVLKVAVKLCRSMVSLSAFSSSDFFVVVRIFKLVPPSQAIQCQSAMKCLEDSVVKQYLASKIATFEFPKGDQFSAMMAAFISAIVHFELIEDGITFFQSRFSPRWSAAIYELLKVCGNLEQSSNFQFVGEILSELLRIRICQISFPAVPASSLPNIETPKPPATASRGKGHIPSHQRRRYRKKVPVLKEPTFTCKKYLTERIKDVLDNISNNFDKDLIERMQSTQTRNSVYPLIFAGVKTLAVALCSDSMLQLDAGLVHDSIQEIIDEFCSQLNRDLIQSTPILFDEAAKHFLNSNQRCLAAFVFRAVGNAVAAVSCFEVEGFERQLLQELKMSKGCVDPTFLHSKFAKLATAFMKVEGGHGYAIGCINELPATVSVHVKQSVFQIWLGEEQVPTRVLDCSSAFVIEQQVEQAIQKTLNGIDCLPKSDVNRIKSCYHELSLSSATLKQPEYGWFVERIIIRVLQAVAPAQFDDVSSLIKFLSFIVKARRAIQINLQTGFKFFMHHFQLQEQLEQMIDVGWELIFPLVSYLFSCSVLYLHLHTQVCGVPQAFKSEINEYIQRKVMPEDAPFVLRQMQSMMRWVESLKHSQVEQLLKDWVLKLLNDWGALKKDARNKKMITALEFETTGDLRSLKRAAIHYRNLGMQQSMERIRKKIEFTKQSMKKQSVLSNDGRVDEFDLIDNDPVMSTSTSWSQSQAVQPTDPEPERLQPGDSQQNIVMDGKMTTTSSMKSVTILKKPA